MLIVHVLCHYTQPWCVRRNCNGFARSRCSVISDFRLTETAERTDNVQSESHSVNSVSPILHQYKSMLSVGGNGRVVPIENVVSPIITM
jgi:hypothetical protein